MRTLLAAGGPAAGAGPTIASYSSATNALAGGVTVTVPVPSGTKAGDLLLAIASSGTETWTQPTGFTLYGTNAASGNSPQVSVFTKTATSMELTSYVFTSNNGLTDATNIMILNIPGNPTPSINGMFSSYHASSSTAAVTIPGVTAVPTALHCLPIAIDAIQQFIPSNTTPPVTGITAGWTGQTIAINIDGSNPNNGSNNNGYNACYAASGPATTDTSSSITAGWTWGGSSANYTGTSVLLFIQP